MSTKRKQLNPALQPTNQAAANAGKVVPAAEVQAEVEKDDLVKVTVPKAFRLTVDGHRTIEYPAGIQDMPASHADHWFTKAVGVNVIPPTKKSAEE